MKNLLLRAMSVGMLLAGWSACCSARAQTHKVAKPEEVVRAVGVYEWTGDLTKPTASRLIPVSIFIDGKLEDAGVYVARPVPFALLSGNVYALQDAGIDKGMLDLAYARHMQAVDATGDLAYDDGWFGYGSVKPLAVAKKPAKLKPSKTLPVLTSSTGGTTDSNRPQLTNKTSGDSKSAGSDQSSTTSSAGTGSGTTSDSSNDPDRPTMKRRSPSDAGTTGNTTTQSGSTTTDTASTQGTGSTPADDPDRPTMKRRSDSSSGTTDSTTTTTASTTDTGSAPADDPDRPTMKRRSSDNTSNTTDTTASTGTGSTPA